jgi:hypothetical protein
MHIYMSLVNINTTKIVIVLWSYVNVKLHIYFTIEICILYFLFLAHVTPAPHPLCFIVIIFACYFNKFKDKTQI